MRRAVCAASGYSSVTSTAHIEEVPDLNLVHELKGKLNKAQHTISFEVKKILILQTMRNVNKIYTIRIVYVSSVWL
jgi:hypothetical protein